MLLACCSSAARLLLACCSPAARLLLVYCLRDTHVRLLLLLILRLRLRLRWLLRLRLRWLLRLLLLNNVVACCLLHVAAAARLLLACSSVAPASPARSHPSNPASPRVCVLIAAYGCVHNCPPARPAGAIKVTPLFTSTSGTILQQLKVRGRVQPTVHAANIDYPQAWWP